MLQYAGCGCSRPPWISEPHSVCSTIVPGSVVAFATFLYGTTPINPVKAGVYNLFEPVVAAVASFVFLHQAFSTADCIGMAAILGGIAFLTVSKK